MLVWWVVRIAAQNDVEGLFGEVTKGSPTKGTPRELTGRFEDGKLRDLIRHDEERAKHWTVPLSKRKKYDAVVDMRHADDAIAFCSGEGDSWESAVATKWRAGQRKDAVAASSGKGESARTNNVFFSGAKAIMSSAKRTAAQT